MRVPPFRKNTFYSCMVLLSISCTSAQAADYQDPGRSGDPESWRTPEFIAEWGLGAMKAQYAYAAGYTGKSIAIGVLDSGFYDKHPGLPNSRFLPVMSNGISGALNAKNNYHGTAVSGSIGASRDGQKDMHGVAFNATVYEANTNATDGFFFGVSDPRFPSSDAKYFSAAYDALAASGVRIISNSWGSQPGSENYSTLSNIVDAYRQHSLANNGQGTWLEAAIKVSRNGVVNNFSAGNTGYDNASMRGALPYFHPELEGNWMTTTGYAQQQGQVYNKCGIAKYWCVAAPTGTLSTRYSDGPPGPSDPKATYGSFNGTSAAAPHASAALALIMERYPYMTNEQALTVLFTTSQNMEVDSSKPIIKRDPVLFGDITPLKISSSKVPNAVVGWGFIDLKKAMNGPAEFLWRSSSSYNLPAGTADTWSNDISEDALIQRKAEESAEIAAWPEAKTALLKQVQSVPEAATPSAELLAGVARGKKLLEAAINANIKGVYSMKKLSAALAAVRADPVGAQLLAQYEALRPGWTGRHSTSADFSNFIAGRSDSTLAQAFAAASRESILASNAKIQFSIGTGDARVAHLQTKTDTDYVGSLLKFGAGTLTLTGNNTYSGGTQLKGGTLGVGSATALGTGTLAMSDATTLQAAADGLKLANAINISGIGNIDTQAYGLTVSGAITDGVASGGLAKLGTGALTLSGVNTYSGPTGVMNGTLRAGSVTGFSSRSAFFVDIQGQLDLNNLDQTIGSLFGSGNVSLGTATLTTGADNSATTFSGQIAGSGGLAKTGSGVFTLASTNTNTYSGGTVVAVGTLQAGAVNAFSAASVMTVNMGATLNAAGYDQRIAGMNLAGTASLAGAKPGTTLTVTGPWVGNGGLLKLGTVSPTVSDRVLLSGLTAVPSGTTTVQFGDAVGLGLATVGNGVEVIGTTGGASVQGNAFVLAGGQLTGGAYEYRLNNIGSGIYLSSSTPQGQIYYRSEVPQFAALPAQLRQASLAMLGNMHQRAGDDDAKTTSANPADGIDGGGRRRAWGRTITTNLDIRQSGTVSPESHGRLDGFQAGTDLLGISNWRAGVYVGQFDGDMRVSGFARGIRKLGVGSNSLRNQYLGAYGTYAGEGGFYADAVLQAGRHRYDVVNPLTQFGSGGSGKGRSLLASIEVGQPFALGGSGDWKIEPQLQLIHQRLSLDDVAITGNTLVRQRPDNAWLARVGVRIKGEVGVGAGRLQPYARFNLYRASGGNDVSSFIASGGRAAIASSTGGTSAELAAGATLALTPTFALYSELGKLWSTGGKTRVKTSVQAGVGARILW